MNRLRKKLRIALGTTLEYAMPLSENKGGSFSRKARELITWARVERASRRGNEEELQTAFASLWQDGINTQYYDRYSDRFQMWFRSTHKDFFKDLVTFSRARHFENMVEIGCGDGRVLDYCAQNMPQGMTFTGIDINKSIIDRNKRAFSNKRRLEFTCFGAQRWLRQNLKRDLLVLAYGGVLEYFSEKKLRDVYGLLASKPGTAMALVEPVAQAHAMDRTTESFSHGEEHSFSHNHRYLLEQAGFDVILNRTSVSGPIKWTEIIAMNRA
ncbi:MULTISPECIES: class I SAM-dependent methyltransferase [unclassified Ruegeria]|uniref:class I SAM-dependent methyltransferase n=1 Tax=unclassified Ruegeria TaxID=2625375 RepID=UPI001489FA0D|nr:MULTISPECIES: class I SAM-dependent methyltransferase [unclassified Ruegeria]